MALSAQPALSIPPRGFVNATVLNGTTIGFGFLTGPVGGTPPYSAAWDFGDGSPPATGLSVQHTYAGPGNYAAKVTLTDSSTPPQSATYDVPLVVQLPPPTEPLTASASGEPVSGVAPLTVSFQGSAQGGTPPYSWSWQFGDGQSEAVQNPSHVYESAGNYVAELTVTDSSSPQQTSNAEVPIGVTPPSQPLECPAPSISPNPGTVGKKSAFSAHPTGGSPPYDYSWRIYVNGIPNPGNVASFEGAPSGRGTWKVSVTVTDSAGAQVASPPTEYVVHP